MNHIKQNIDNLTHLWKIAGQTFQGYSKNSEYSLSIIDNAEWPNRIWIESPPSVTSLEEVSLKMKNHPELTFSYFKQGQENDNFTTLNHFKPKSLQYGMSLPLNKKIETKRKIEFIQVNNEVKASLWSNAFFDSFGYKITANTVVKTCNEIQYFLVYDNKNIVGTVILLVTNNTAGIHSLGVIQSQRKKGYALSIMQHILNKAIDLNCNLATLQASEMAKNMYLKMGFTTNFLMENYTLKQ